MSRPSVRIDDLASPKLPDEVRAALASAEDVKVDFSVDAVLAAAAEQIGLANFGDDAFHKHLDVLCRALDESGSTAAGRVGHFGALVGHAVNRLKFEDLLKRHPEIDDEEIVAPIVIAGLPRSGTTHLHNLISSDPRLRSLPYWESCDPFPLPSEAGPAGAPDPRIAACAEMLAPRDAVLPYSKWMHDMYPEHVHEEIDLLAMGFSTMLFECLAPIPIWRDYYLATDQGPAYDYLKRILKALQFLRGPKRWVLKSPQHLEQFEVLMRTFPDATVVVTHRDPVSVTASFATMISYSSRMSREHPTEAGDYWIDRIERMLRAAARDRHLLPESQSMDVRFHDFMADDIATVERIYAKAGGLPMTPDVRAAMDQFMLDHPRGKYGRILYDYEDFGTTREERRKTYEFYVEQFDLEVEGS